MACDKINPSLLAQAIPGIPQSKSMAEFQKRCGIKSSLTAMELLHFLNFRGVGTMSGLAIRFTRIDRLNVLLTALNHGCRPELLSSKLDWRDFEMFTSSILEKNEYHCKSNINFANPKVQIDVVAKLGRIGLVIDCKHWKIMTRAKMGEFADDQLRRTRIYIDKMNESSIMFPVIITLNELPDQVVDGVPFVSIAKLDSFLRNYEFYQDTISHIS